MRQIFWIVLFAMFGWVVVAAVLSLIWVKAYAVILPTVVVLVGVFVAIFAVRAQVK